MRTKKITIIDREVTIKKLPLNQLAELFEEIKNAPKEVISRISSLDSASNEQFLETLPLLIADLLPFVAGIVVKASNTKDLTEQELIDLAGVDDIVILVDEVLELNNVKEIISRVKKMRALVPTSKSQEVKSLQTQAGK